jgi:hypothetical protein
MAPGTFRGIGKLPEEEAPATPRQMAPAADGHPGVTGGRSRTEGGRKKKEKTMKKNSQNSSHRILGRRLARELPNELLSGAASASAIGVWTYTLLYPSDPGGPTWDSGGGGPILV